MYIKDLEKSLILKRSRFNITTTNYFESILKVDSKFELVIIIIIKLLKKGNILSCEELELSILRSIGKVTTQKTIANELGFSVGKINYVLKALGDKGLLKIENFYNSKNKLQYKYLLTEEGIKEKIFLTQKFIARKKAEYEELQSELDQDIKMGLK